jgi:hypothetical protein
MIGLRLPKRETIHLRLLHLYNLWNMKGLQVHTCSPFCFLERSASTPSSIRKERVQNHDAI